MQLSASPSTNNRIKSLIFFGILASFPIFAAAYFGILPVLLQHLSIVLVQESLRSIVNTPWLFYKSGAYSVILKSEEDKDEKIEDIPLPEIVQTVHGQLLNKGYMFFPKSIAIRIVPDDSSDAFTTGFTLLPSLGIGPAYIAVNIGLLKNVKKYADNYNKDKEEADKIRANDIVAAIIAHEMVHIAHHTTTKDLAKSVLQAYFYAFAFFITSRTLNIIRVPKYIEFMVGMIPTLLSKAHNRTEQLAADETVIELGYGKNLLVSFDMMKESRTINVTKTGGQTQEIYHDSNNSWLLWFRSFVSTHPSIDERKQHAEALMVDQRGEQVKLSA